MDGTFIALILWPSSLRAGEIADEMDDGLKQTCWYWVRRDDGSVAPYRFHQAKTDSRGRQLGEFFVGSFIRTYPLSAVVGEAEMPSADEA